MHFFTGKSPISLYFSLILAMHYPYLSFFSILYLVSPMKIKIINAKLLCFEDDFQIKEADLFIDDGLIKGIGSAKEDYTSAYILDAKGKLLMPGLVNCHTHAYMSLFRNFADDLPFDEWLFKKIMPVEDVMKAEHAYWLNLLSCMEMIKTGTTCFADMQMFKNQSVRAVTESGMRAVISRGLIGESTKDEAAKSRLDEAYEEMEFAKGNDRISFMLGPHAIYTCGEELLRELPDIALEKKIGIMIHLAEGNTEYVSSIKGHKKSPTAYLESLNFFRSPTLAAHCVHLDDEDIAILAKRKVSVATNPVSNMKLGNGFAPISKMIKAGINICVGTDSASSNNSLNMFRELSMLSYIHKGLEKDALKLPAKEVLRFGTLGGAKALGLEEKLGGIKVGKKADLILIDLDKPWLRPVNNPIFSLIYSATGTEVDTVIIDGKIIMEKGELKTLDEEKIYSEVEKIAGSLL